MEVVIMIMLVAISFQIAQLRHEMDTEIKELRKEVRKK